jgi:hypothetical protein
VAHVPLTIVYKTGTHTRKGTHGGAVEALRNKLEVAGPIPDGVILIFHGHNPSGCTTALVSTQSLTEMSTRNIFWWVKAAGT